jgi:hypothetical protein
MDVDNVPLRVGDDCGECPIYDCTGKVRAQSCDKVISSLGGRLFAVWTGKCAGGHLCSITVQIRELSDAPTDPAP